MAKTEIIPTSFRIKDVLDERHLSQAQLAEKMNVSASAIKQFLNAKSLSTSTLQKIANGLNVPLWQLIISPSEILKEAQEANMSAKGTYGTVITCPNCKKELKIQLVVSDNK